MTGEVAYIHTRTHSQLGSSVHKASPASLHSFPFVPRRFDVVFCESRLFVKVVFVKVVSLFRERGSLVQILFLSIRLVSTDRRFSFQSHRLETLFSVQGRQIADLSDDAAEH